MVVVVVVAFERVVFEAKCALCGCDVIDNNRSRSRRNKKTINDSEEKIRTDIAARGELPITLAKPP